MSDFFGISTTTFVLVVLLLFALYNVVVFIWFKFFATKDNKHIPMADKESANQEEEELPF